MGVCRVLRAAWEVLWCRVRGKGEDKWGETNGQGWDDTSGPEGA